MGEHYDCARRLEAAQAEIARLTAENLMLRRKLNPDVLDALRARVAELENGVRHAFNAGYARGTRDRPIGLGEVATRLAEAWEDFQRDRRAALAAGGEGAE